VCQADSVKIAGHAATDLQVQQAQNFMEQSPSWEANRSFGSQEIPCILQNLKVQYHIHKSP
jgi:hypothetical protein